MAGQGSVEGPEALVRRFWRQVFDQRNLPAARQLVTADFRWRGSLGSESDGIEEFLGYAEAAQAAMPDLTVTLQEVAVAGSQVWARLGFRATHHGELLGQLGTGQRISYVGQAVHDVRDGRLSRVWVVADTLSLYRQLVHKDRPRT
jgi:predicted ester cyclase